MTSEVRNRKGPAPTMVEGAPDDTLLMKYECGIYNDIWLTNAEKTVMDDVILHKTPKCVAYLAVYDGGKNKPQSASSWFSHKNRINYMAFLRSKQVLHVSAGISDFVKRITSLIKVTAYDTIYPFGGIVPIQDLPEHVLSSCKVSYKYGADGECTGATLAMYTLNEIMSMLTDLEEIDPTLAAHFKTQLQQSKPTLTRSKPATVTEEKPKPKQTRKTTKKVEPKKD